MKKRKSMNRSLSKKLQKTKRTKERTISDIIEKVSTWRKLYNGVIAPVNGKE
jgi:hypothetical protein